MFNTWEDASTTSYNQGNFADNYALGSIGGVSISEDGSRIAISTSNYSEADFSLHNPFDFKPTSRCVEMVLIMEYHKAFHSFKDTFLFSRSLNNGTNIPSGSNTNTWQEGVLDTFTLDSNFSTRNLKFTATVSGDYFASQVYFQTGTSFSGERIYLSFRNTSRTTSPTTLQFAPHSLGLDEGDYSLLNSAVWPPQPVGLSGGQ